MGARCPARACPLTLTLTLTLTLSLSLSLSLTLTLTLTQVPGQSVPTMAEGLRLFLSPGQTGYTGARSPEPEP